MKSVKPSTEESRESRLLIDVQEVASLLGCSARHVTRLSDAGQMPGPLKFGRLSRWKSSDISAWVASGCAPVRTPKKVG